jgi:RNA polymerase sigma factor (sigma-70 family)
MTGQPQHEEIDDHDPRGRDFDEAGIAANPANSRHLQEVATEEILLLSLGSLAQTAALREVLSGTRKLSVEALVRVSARAHRGGNEALMKLAFEAAAKMATPLLLSQAFGQAKDEREEQAQEILVYLLEAIRGGRSKLAETFFGSFAKRRAIDLFRKRDARLEAKLDRAEPQADWDPIDDVPDRTAGVDTKALLQVAVERMPPKVRTAFIQKYQLEMTQEEIAQHHGVTVRTVYSWLQQAAELLGLKGDEE